jgi:HAD superfamily hydrolase (TIGR01509 family)
VRSDGRWRGTRPKRSRRATARSTRELLPERRPLPVAVELLGELREAGIAHGIATSGRRPEIDVSLEALGITAETIVVARGDVLRAKPEPDLFVACSERLAVPPEECYVIGDAVWDLLAARRARMLSVGLLSGGYGEDELTRRRVSRLPRRRGAAAIAR